jgi:cytochrome b561
VAIAYLALSLVLAATLNARAPWLRALGSLVAAVGLVMMVVSIALANLDGTFTAVPASAPMIHRITPTVLNIQSVIASITVIFLIWTAWTNARRPITAALPVRNDERQFGKASRGFHWVIAVMMFCLVPIGLFMAILPTSSPDRAAFVAAHQSLGLSVLVLVAARLAWLRISPPPSLVARTQLERGASRTVHVCLYAALVAFPVSGYLISQGASIDFYGWTVRSIGWAGTTSPALVLHDWALPILFYVMVSLHLGAVLKRHFVQGETAAVRRMLR